MTRPELRVEGGDDDHVIRHLLIRNGIDYDAKPWPPDLPEVKEVGDKQALLDGMELAVKTSTGRAVGFVLDADVQIQSRWEAVRNRLTKVGVAVPNTPPSEGFVGTSAQFQSTVGIWLMPDNQHDGKLEDFLRSLIDENDDLIGHAESATNTAKFDLNAKFSEPDHIKAVIHSWLAWQKEPGCPYGKAIRACFFGHDSPAARAFVAWFRVLYQIVD